MKQLSSKRGQINLVVSSGVGCTTGDVAVAVQRTQGVVDVKGFGVGTSVGGDSHIDGICDPRTKRCGAKDNNRATLLSTTAVTALNHNLG